MNIYLKQKKENHCNVLFIPHVREWLIGDGNWPVCVAPPPTAIRVHLGRNGGFKEPQVHSALSISSCKNGARTFEPSANLLSVPQGGVV